MFTPSKDSLTDGRNQNCESNWRTYYPLLQSTARYLVYSYHVPSWRGQEDDIVQDIVQETARRMIERSQKAERGEVAPIYSFKQMMTVTAQNYCKDLRRHDLRLLRVPSDSGSLDFQAMVPDQTHPLDAVTESVYREQFFTLIAHEISTYPDKQRKALLIDLANRMAFDTQPSPLQKAFLEVGIQLQQYQQLLPADPQERKRHISLLSQAYKRIADLSCIKQYLAVA